MASGLRMGIIYMLNEEGDTMMPTFAEPNQKDSSREQVWGSFFIKTDQRRINTYYASMSYADGKWVPAQGGAGQSPAAFAKNSGIQLIFLAEDYQHPKGPPTVSQSVRQGHVEGHKACTRDKHRLETLCAYQRKQDGTIEPRETTQILFSKAIASSDDAVIDRAIKVLGGSHPKLVDILVARKEKLPAIRDRAEFKKKVVGLMTTMAATNKATGFKHQSDAAKLEAYAYAVNGGVAPACCKHDTTSAKSFAKLLFLPTSYAESFDDLNEWHVRQFLKTLVDNYHLDVQDVLAAAGMGLGDIARVMSAPNGLPVLLAARPIIARDLCSVLAAAGMGVGVIVTTMSDHRIGAMLSKLLRDKPLDLEAIPEALNSDYKN